MKKWTLIPSFSKLFWKYVKPKQLVFFECSLRKLSKKALILFANTSTYTFYLWPIPSPVCGGVYPAYPPLAGESGDTRWPRQSRLECSARPDLTWAQAAGRQQAGVPLAMLGLAERKVHLVLSGGSEGRWQLHLQPISGNTGHITVCQALRTASTASWIKKTAKRKSPLSQAGKFLVPHSRSFSYLPRRSEDCRGK